MITTLRPRLFLTLYALFLTSCATALPEHFYALNTDTAPNGAVSNNAEFSLSVDRITLPEMVDRPQIVLSSADHTVRLMEAQRWAESLRQAIPRVVIGNLRRQFPRASIAASNASTVSAQPTFKVAMDIDRLDSRLGERVDVVVHWRLRNATGVVRDSVSTLRENLDGTSFDALVAAHDKILGRLSSDIGEAIAAAIRPQ
jgi:uncharacterized lipoprotein YmbA